MPPSFSDREHQKRLKLTYLILKTYVFKDKIDGAIILIKISVQFFLPLTTISTHHPLPPHTLRLATPSHPPSPTHPHTRTQACIHTHTHKHTKADRQQTKSLYWLGDWPCSIAFPFKTPYSLCAPTHPHYHQELLN